MNIRRSAKFFWQRCTRKFDDSDTWDMDYSLAALILPRLKRFKEITRAHPAELSWEEWNIILDKMIAAFEFAHSGRRFDAPPEDFDKYQKGINLFAKYYFALWW
jgi:hypothetical protein